MDNIDVSKKINQKELYDRKAIHLLVEFQTYNKNLNRGIVEKLILRFIRRLPWKIIRWSLTKVRKIYGFKVMLKCLRLVIISSIKQRKNSSFLLLHDDVFGPNNIVVANDGYTYFLDFEGAISEKKWLLTDIVELCITVNSLDFDVKLFEEYMKQLKNTNKVNVKLDIKTRLRMALLRRSIQILFSSTDSAKRNRTKWESFLLNYILDENSFTRWYEELGINI